MAIDISNLSIEELQALAIQAQQQAQQKLTQQQLEELEEVEGRKERISHAEAELTALLGPEGAPPYVPGGPVGPSIRGLLAYSPADLAANSGIAITMLFQGLEKLTLITRDIAVALGTE